MFNKYIKVNQNINITAFERKKNQFPKYQGVRVADLALTQPYWPGVKSTRGQGQAESGLARPLDSVAADYREKC